MYEKPSEYLDRTKPAVSALLQVTEKFRAPLYREPPSVLVGDFVDAETRDWEISRWREEKADRHARRVAAEREYFDNTFSLAAVGGALLQIAYSAINAYRQPAAVPGDLSIPIRGYSKPSKFYCGRQVRGIPLGLIVYAGRNHAAHVDEGAPTNPVVRAVFDALAGGGPSVSGNRSWDPAFDILNDRLKHYAHNVLALIGLSSNRMEDNRHLRRGYATDAWTAVSASRKRCLDGRSVAGLLSWHCLQSIA